jgi:uroporphyrinogen-III decarboxylase
MPGKGELISGGLRHGHTFLQLQDIRGYQNLLYDFADDEPNVRELIAILENFNAAIIRHYLEIGVDIMTYPDDLGMQKGPMLTPDQFHTYIKPSYQRLMKPARDAGIPVHMHSDGDIRDLIDDIIDGGVDIINLQDTVNGIDWIARRFAGKTCVDIDIDRQNVTVFGSPADIENHIARIVKSLGSIHGGLMMVFGLYPGAPLENVKATMDAMEQYAQYY